MEPILFRYRGRDLCAVDIALVRATKVTEPGIDSPFAAFTDDDIDNLFND